MSIIDLLSDQDTWNFFLENKSESGSWNKCQLDDLSSFISNKEYVTVVDKINSKDDFLPPTKRLISKQSSQKKRVVYTYSREENYVLKLMTYLLVRRYDFHFSKNLYSFRANHGVRKAIEFLKKNKYLSEKYVYKVDIQNYFNSVDIHMLLPMLNSIMSDDLCTYNFIERILRDERVSLPNGDIIIEKKGIMAGVPISSFLANVYLSQLDWKFFNEGNRYARYSDDIIVFSNDYKQCLNDIRNIHEYLKNMNLKVNPSKEFVTCPHEQWDFLGLSYKDGTFDISPISAMKLKKKMWRKSRALLRWKKRKRIDNIFAAKAFVKSFNKKLYDNPVTSELTWTRWYFPMITTTKTLTSLDHYMQECIRYIVTEKRNKKRFCFNYEMIKDLGYKPLVHEYYKVKKSKE